jgi:hypothetical protein
MFRYGPQGRSWTRGEKLAPREEVDPEGRSWSLGGRLTPRGEVGPQRWSWPPEVKLAPGKIDPKGWSWSLGETTKGAVDAYGWRPSILLSILWLSSHTGVKKEVFEWNAVLFTFYHRKYLSKKCCNATQPFKRSFELFLLCRYFTKVRHIQVQSIDCSC